MRIPASTCRCSLLIRFPSGAMWCCSVPTGQLNRWLRDLTALKPHPKGVSVVWLGTCPLTDVVRPMVCCSVRCPDVSVFCGGSCSGGQERDAEIHDAGRHFLCVPLINLVAATDWTIRLLARFAAHACRVGGTQVRTRPPTFAIFSSRAKDINEASTAACWMCFPLPCPLC